MFLVRHVLMTKIYLFFEVAKFCFQRTSNYICQFMCFIKMDSQYLNIEDVR
ncbi:hypothetical protein HanRHA438_Chr10g0454931 [Helianthus annuus]|nr:hypothetical protein HanRHA438_Chr10g0454931 [Helianthus annuus]